MFSQFNPLTYIMGGIILFLTVTAGVLTYENSTLNEEVETLTTKLNNERTSNAILEVQSASCLDSINRQNLKVEAISIDRDDAINKLEQWKSKPPKVRYEVIYKTKEVKSDKCEDIKSAINSIRSIDFSSL